jgi:plasmid stabilization system protein ParE
MRRRYKLSRDARTDLLKAWNYLAESVSFDVADKVLADLYEGMDKVARTPGLGHLREDLTTLPVKFYLVHKYLVVYTPEKPVGIVRVIHSARDIRAILGHEPEDP